jgi:hypothetical protein
LIQSRSKIALLFIFCIQINCLRSSHFSKFAQQIRLVLFFNSGCVPKQIFSLSAFPPNEERLLKFPRSTFPFFTRTARTTFVQTKITLASVFQSDSPGADYTHTSSIWDAAARRADFYIRPRINHSHRPLLQKEWSH